MHKWKALEFSSLIDNETEAVPKKKQRKSSKTKTAPISRKVDLVERPRCSFNFQLKLAPKVVEDLVVQPKKVQEVESWLLKSVLRQGVVEESSPFLLITGPTGSGKTSTITTLCKCKQIAICEWASPVDQDYEIIKGPNQIDRFIEFISDTKYNSIFDSFQQKKIVIVKDFPNVFVRRPEEFHAILNQFRYSKVGIVFICTDSSKSDVNLSRKLFPPEILAQYNIVNISFNPCINSRLKSIVLKRAQSLVAENPHLFKMPSSATIEAILASAMGDIRGAINQFYLASLIGCHDMPTELENESSKNTTVKSSKRKRAGGTLIIKAMLRDESLGLFHGLGRVLNPKRQETETGWRFTCNVEKLVDEFCLQPSVFTGFLFENYLKYFGDIADVAKAADILSFSQRFLVNSAERHDTTTLATWISAMGLMVFNEHRVSKWNQICAPQKMQKIVYAKDTKGLGVEDYFYYNLIKKCNKFHRFNV